MDKQSTFRTVLTLTFARLIVNMGRRFPYPFLPGIASELNVSLSSVQSVVAAQAGIGVTSPLFGPLADRYGRRRVMMGSLLLMAGSSFIGAMLPQFSAYAVIMILLGISKMMFDPSLVAYLSDKVPYHKRGTAIGATELSWAGSLIIIAPLAGFLLERYGLQAVFLFLGCASLTALAVITLFLPPDHEAAAANGRVITPRMIFNMVRKNPAALGAMAYTFSLSAANETFFINYGEWMNLSFAMTLGALGIATTVISAAEIIGEFTVIGVADRFGKRRLALAAVTLSSLCYIVMPFLDFAVPAALIGLFVLFLFTETGIVAAIPLYTEVMPAYRAVMVSSTTGAAALGRLSGAALGGFVFSSTGNFYLIGALSLSIGLFASFMLWRFVHEAEQNPVRSEAN